MAATLDEILERLDDLDNEDLAKEFRKVIKTQAAEIIGLREQTANYERQEKTAVLKEAGVTDKAYDRFLRDWQEAHGDDEFTVENVKAAADEFGYQLVDPAAGDATPATTPDVPDTDDRIAQLNTVGTNVDGLPPDLDTKIAKANDAVATGDRAAISDLLALNRQKLEKAQKTA